MDGGAFRAPQSSDRRVPSRPPETSTRLPEDTQPAHEQPRTSFRTEQPPVVLKKSVFKRLIAPIIIVIAIIAGFSTGAFVSNKLGAEAPIDNSKYQAVFSTSGLVYFGKLQSYNSEYFKLTQAYSVEQQPATEDNEKPAATVIKLIKRSDAVYNPDNEMIIPKSQVLFYENLKADSKAALEMQNDQNP